MQPYHAADKAEFQNYSVREGFYIFADIRGFTRWSEKYQHDVKKLITYTYNLAIEIFGKKRDQELLSRVVKFLGDGFFAVKEYDDSSFETRFSNLFQRIYVFFEEYPSGLSRMRLHEIGTIPFSFGISYGTSERFNFPGMAIDYIGERINYSSRLCSIAEGGEAIVDIDLQESLLALIKSGKVGGTMKRDKVDLKNIGNTSVLRWSGL